MACNQQSNMGVTTHMKCLNMKSLKGHKRSLCFELDMFILDHHDYFIITVIDVVPGSINMDARQKTFLRSENVPFLNEQNPHVFFDSHFFVVQE